MTIHEILLLAASIVLMLVAHGVRSARHASLFPNSGKMQRFDLLLGLALSYAVNTLLPLRIGELVRIWYVAKKYEVRTSYVAATVAAERLTDILVVSIILAGFFVLLGSGSEYMLLLASISMALLSGSLVACSFLIVHFHPARRVVWAAASIFNDRIKSSVVDLFWSFSQIVVSGDLLRRPYVAKSAWMWTLYLTAYSVFALASHMPTAEVSYALIGAPLRPLMNQLLANRIAGSGLALLAFTCAPVLLILLYGTIREHRQIAGAINAFGKFGLRSFHMSKPATSTRFLEKNQYEQFLAAHFGQDQSIISKFGLQAVGDAIVHKILPGGSDAVTALVEVDGALMIRKFASQDAGVKLSTQADWLQAHGDKLPLARVMKTSRQYEHFRYDMPYLITSRDFFDVIHSVPLEQSKAILSDVIQTVSDFHSSGELVMAKADDVDLYLEEKVCGNAKRILKFASAVLPSNEFSINGIGYSLSAWDRLIDMNWLRDQIQSREVGNIHGDLTIENIIVDPQHPKGWYIIDPNSENILNTPLIDWAKLMQSLHLGYEGLNHSSKTLLSGNDIRLNFTRSKNYSELHGSLENVLQARLRSGQLREVAFHELVNYLRLTPYKIRQSPQKGLTFFACTSILLDRYLRYDNK